jgi:Uma2 family endonuclease
MKTLAEKQIFTYDDIECLPEGNYEIIAGERYDMTPTSFEHGDLEIRLGEFLRRHIKDKGYVAVGEVGVLISKRPLKIRAADVVYISKEKSPERPKGILEIPPDLIIEIISETNTAWEITDKVKDYLLIGAERIILIEPKTKTASLYQKGKKEAILYDYEEEITILEGLTLHLKDIL